MKYEGANKNYAEAGLNPIRWWGRAYETSNPFRPWQSENAIWTTQTFDPLGRVLTITTPDSAVVSTSYSGEHRHCFRPTGSKQRKSVSDALGRMISGLRSAQRYNLNFNYLTTCEWLDVLDDLTKVTQDNNPGSPVTKRSRVFVYDSLKRLTSATNPESGTVSYQYDNLGNLTRRPDARSVVATYALR